MASARDGSIIAFGFRGLRLLQGAQVLPQGRVQPPIETKRRCAMNAVSGVSGAVTSQPAKSFISAGTSAGDGKLWRPVSVRT
jgi:hypothetical protein